MQDYLILITATHTEKSKTIGYVEVMDAVADHKDIMLTLIHNLYTRFIAEKNQGFDHSR